MRVAIYFTPDKKNILTKLAASWLGWDAFNGKRISCLIKRDIQWVAKPAHYGFHATMKAPFSLHNRTTLQDLEKACAIFCSKSPAIFLPTFKIAKLGNFFALVPQYQSTELVDFASSIVQFFESFRAPLTQQEIEKRNPNALDEKQFQYLMDYGYPYIFDRFRFHMTLTSDIPLNEQEIVETSLKNYFKGAISEPICLDGLGLFVEPARELPFYCHSYHTLGQNIRKI